MKVKGIVMSAVIIASVLVAFSAPAAAYWDYDGYIVKTMTDGTIQGDVYINYGDKQGLDDGRIDGNRDGPYRTNYSVPNGNSVKWARLFVGIWGGNEVNCGWLNTTLHNGTQLNYLGNVSIGDCGNWPDDPPDGKEDNNPTYSQTEPSVYGTGHGCWMVAYNVTNNVSLNAWNNVTATTYTCWPSDLDGRIYGIVLVVVYENTSLAKIQYWVNEGNVNLHYNMSDPPYNYVLDNTTTWFNGTAYNSTEANLTVVYYTGSTGEPDYLYFNPSNAVRTDMKWTISTNRTWQLDQNDVADERVDSCSGSSCECDDNSIGSYGFDFNCFSRTHDSTPLKDIINKTANNSAFFWRGHDDDGDDWIFAQFGGSGPEEGEDYVHPIVAVLRLKDVTHDYDFSSSLTGTPGTDAWAFKDEVSANPPTTCNGPSTEFSSTEYGYIKTDNGVYQSDDSDSSGNYAAHRFNFSIDEVAADIEKINVTWNGIGKHDDEEAPGARLYIWKDGTGYEELDSTDLDTEDTLTGEKTSSISSYINANNVTILVKQKNAHSGNEKSYIETDYVKLVITPDP